MKKLTSILFCFIINFVFSQNKNDIRLYYQLFIEGIPNSIYILDYSTSDKVSYFYSSNLLINDSLNEAIRKKMQMSNITVNTNNFKRSFIKEIIKTEFDKTVIYTNIESDFFKYPLDISPILWTNISGSTNHTLGFKTSQALTSFGGRKWVAHFSEELPFSIGPYKFKDLPGAIVKISDEDNNFEFDLIGIEKINTKINIDERKYIKINLKKFLHLYEQFLNDPGKNMREGLIITDDGNKFYVEGGISKELIDSKIKNAYSGLHSENKCIEVDGEICKINNKILLKNETTKN